MNTFDDIKKFYYEGKYWGLSTSIDVSGCDEHIIKSEGLIRKFIIDVCDLIDMKLYGEPIIHHFGKEKEIEGYSFIQLIETSSITGHFSNLNNKAFIDIFSCKFYDPKIAADFSGEFFNGESIVYTFRFRE